jgi:hypothetical protein
LTGSITFAGSLAKQVSAIRTGTLSFDGATASIRQLRRAQAGTLAFASTRTRTPFLRRVGVLDLGGEVARTVSKATSGILDFAATTLRTPGRLLTGTLSFSGSAGSRLLGAVIPVLVSMREQVRLLFTLGQRVRLSIDGRASKRLTIHQAARPRLTLTLSEFPMQIDVGDDVRLDFTITNNDTGNLYDPTTLDVQVQPPVGPLQIFTGTAIIKDAEGTYHLYVNVTMSGTWRWKVIAGGDARGTGVRSFNVIRTVME